MTFEEWFKNNVALYMGKPDFCKVGWDGCKKEVLQILVAANRTCFNDGFYIKYEDLKKEIKKL